MHDWSHCSPLTILLCFLRFYLPASGSVVEYDQTEVVALAIQEYLWCKCSLCESPPLHESLRLSPKLMPSVGHLTLMRLQNYPQPSIPTDGYRHRSRECALLDLHDQQQKEVRQVLGCLECDLSRSLSCCFLVLAGAEHVARPTILGQHQ